MDSREKFPGSLHFLADEIAFSHNTTVAEIVGKSREQHIVRARHELMGEMWRAGLSMPAIGRLVGNRDHTTVLAGVKKVIPRDEYRQGVVNRAPHRAGALRIA